MDKLNSVELNSEKSSTKFPLFGFGYMLKVDLSSFSAIPLQISTVISISSVPSHPFASVTTTETSADPLEPSYVMV